MSLKKECAGNPTLSDVAFPGDYDMNPSLLGAAHKFNLITLTQIKGPHYAGLISFLKISKKSGFEEYSFLDLPGVGHFGFLTSPTYIG